MMTKRYAICVRVDDEFADAAPTCRLREAIAVTMRAHHVPPDAGATLLVTGDDEIRKLNRRFRGVDSPTDVLSFPAVDDPGDVLSSTEPEPYLGDIVVAFPYTAAHAEQDGHALEDVLILLAVH